MPNRIIKESICTSDSIDGLGWFEEVLFYRLIVNCDDFGRFDGRTAVIKNRLFPLKENLTLKTVQEATEKLARAGLVTPYEAGGRPFLFLPTWSDHQSVRAKRSKYPEPEIICNQMQADESKCPRNPIQSNAYSESESNTKPTTRTRVGGDGVNAVLSDYLNRINPSASPMSLDELRGYAEVLGEAVCTRAFDIALDTKKTTWPYIRGILRRLQSQGVKCLADWEAIEKARDDRHGRSGSSPAEAESKEEFHVGTYL